MILLATGGATDSFVQFITVLIIFIFVLVITYCVTRWISGFQKTQYVGRNVELLETCRLADSKYLQIVRAGDKYLVIAVCKDTVTMLTELSEDSLDLEVVATKQKLDFKEIWESVKKRPKDISKQEDEDK